MNQINDEITTEIKNANILIVDDEPANNKLLEKMLATRGYHNVVCTQDPFQVIPLYEEYRSDLILLDLEMPNGMVMR